MKIGINKTVTFKTTPLDQILKGTFTGFALRIYDPILRPL